MFVVNDKFKKNAIVKKKEMNRYRHRLVFWIIETPY